MPSQRIYCDTKALMQTRGKDSSSKYQSPRGFTLATLDDSVSRDGSSNDEQDTYLRTKKAWDLAIQPAKTLPMQIFMAWMSGTGVQIFSIIVTGMVLMSPIKAIIGVNEAFSSLERSGKTSIDLSMQKLAYVTINFGAVLFGLYRLSVMGLLPTHASDWLPFLPPKQIEELLAS